MNMTPPDDRPGKVLASGRGVTLFELLTASTIGLLVLLAFGRVDVGRIYLTNQVRADAGLLP